MKKCLKILTFTLCCIVSAIVFCACTDNTEKILVEKISVDKPSITLVLDEDNLQSSSDEIKISYEPANATQIDIEFFQYDNSLIEISPKQKSGDTFVIKAKDFEGTSKQTTIGVRMKGNVKVQAKCQVKVEKKSLAKLQTPTNLKYNTESNRIEWDASTHTVDEGFDGYTLKINNDEIYCTNNFYEINSLNEILVAQVKANSIVSGKDSNYSSSYTFKVLDTVQNFKHQNGNISWDKVENASSYKYKVGVLKEEIVDANTTSFNYDFINKGTYTFSIRAIGENILDEQGNVSCYVFDSKPVELTVTKLSAPENFVFSKIFYWDTPSLTEQLPKGYEIVEIVGEQETVIATTNLNHYSLPHDISVGNHTYKIRAIGDGINTISSDFSASKTVRKLATPTNLRVENGMITWDRDANAVSYHLIFMGMFNGKLYTDDFYNTDKSVNPYFYIDQPSQENNKVTFDFSGDKFSGDYIIKIASVSDAENTVDSEFTLPISVTKLEAPELTSFSLSNNVLSWSANPNASSYNIEFFGEQTILETVYTNSFALPVDLGAMEFSFKVTAIGDSAKKTLTSDKSELGYGVKLSSPEVFVQNGVLKWQMETAQDFSSYILSINGTEQNVEKLDEFTFEDYDAGTYSVKVKALGGNASKSGNKYVVGTCDSNFSSVLSVTKYSAPVLNLENGEVHFSVEDSSGGTVLGTKKDINITQTEISARVYGQDNEHITSDLSNVLVVTNARTPSNLKLENGVLSWDELDEAYKGSYFQLELTFVGQDSEASSSKTVLDMGTSHSKDFSLDDVLSGTYSARVRIIGTTSGINENLVLNSEFSSYFDFYKLPKPTLTATSALNGDNLEINTMLGYLTWEASSVGLIKAVGYNIRAEKSGKIIELDVKDANTFQLPNEAGKYKISIEAYGDSKQIINSGYSETIEFEKLKKATNLKISNDGTISWNSDYNKANDAITGAITSFPKNLRVVFAIEINGNLYSPYNFSKILNNGVDETAFAEVNKVKSVNFNDIREFSMNATDAIKFTDGTYKIRILTMPINAYQENLPVIGQWGYKTDLVADYSDYIELTKLETPYGFRMDYELNDDLTDSDYVLSWTRSLNSNVSGYEVLIKEAGKQDSEGEVFSVGTNTKFNFTQNYLLSKGITNGNYIAKVRCITSSTNYIYSDYCEELSISILNDIELTISDGKLSWAKNSNAVSYKFIFTKNGEQFTVILGGNLSEYEMTLNNNRKFTPGEYNIKVQVIGNTSSNYNNKIYISALTEKDYGNFVKLETPTNLHINEGLINFDCDSEPDYFQLLVSQNGKQDKEKITIDKTGLSYEYELAERFGAGKYSFNLQAMGGTRYINSEISSEITPSEVTKLDSPTLYLKDGILNWNYIENANTYQIQISGSSFKHEVKMPEGVTSFDISGELTTITGEKIVLGNGDYSIKIKSIGTNRTFLNSNFSTVKKFRKLITPKNVEIAQGKLTWQAISALGDAPNGLALYIKASGSSSYNEPIILSNNQNSFDFDGEKYPAGTYSVYLQTIGDTKNSFEVGNICGTPTEVFVVEKLGVPTNTKIEYTSDEEYLGKFTFDALNRDGYDNPEYELKLKITIKEKVYEINLTLDDDSVEGGKVCYNIAKQIENISLSSGAEIQFSVKYLGQDKFIDSQFCEPLSIVIPQTPDLEVVIDENNNFTGKISWNSVKVGDNQSNYVLIYQFISLDKANKLGITDVNSITEEHWGEERTEITTSNCHAYVTRKGYYRFKVISTLVIGSGSDITTIKSPENDYTSAYNYNLFSGGIGTEEDPFIVDSVSTFNYIRYNLTAHYALSKNDSLSQGINFVNSIIYPIGSEAEQFTGSFNGNGKMLYNITLSDVSENSSIFDYVGKSGIIKNVIVQNIIITNGSNVGGIVGKNEGQIVNVKVGCKQENGQYVYDGITSISPYATSDQFYSRVGGICGYNLGTITNCESYAVIAPRNDYIEVRSGGIAGENSGTISYCYNYGDVGGTGTAKTQIFSNMSGGICGFNTSNITYCGNFGNVFAQSRSANKVSQGAYAGGIVAYNNRGTISYCFNDNSNKDYSSDDTIVSKTQIYGLTAINIDVFVGGIVAYNNVASTIQNCYTISNVRYELSGTAIANVGTIIGENKSSFMEVEQGYRVYILSDSMVKTIGNNISQLGNIVEYSKTKSGYGLEQFKTAVSNSFNLIVGQIKSKENVWKRLLHGLLEQY